MNEKYIIKGIKDSFDKTDFRGNDLKGLISAVEIIGIRKTKEGIEIDTLKISLDFLGNVNIKTVKSTIENYLFSINCDCSELLLEI